MVAFGDPRLAAPLTGNRSAGATGRWVDARTFAVDLPAPLPGDQRCSYTLVPGLKDASGSPIAARRFDFDTGGANVRAVVPETGGGAVEEDQIFLLALNAAPISASVATKASCRIEGVGEVVPLDLLPSTTRNTLVAGGARDWRLRQFLTITGWRKNDDTTVEKQPHAKIAAARCRRAGTSRSCGARASPQRTGWRSWRGQPPRLQGPPGVPCAPRMQPREPGGSALADHAVAGQLHRPGAADAGAANPVDRARRHRTGTEAGQGQPRPDGQRRRVHRAVRRTHVVQADAPPTSSTKPDGR